MSAEDIQEIKSDIKELTRNVQEIAKMHAESMTVHRFTEQKIQSIDNEIYSKEGGLLMRMGALEIAQSNDKLRWGLTGTIAMLLLTSIGGIYAVVTKPLSDSTDQLKQAQISNSEMAEKLDDQTKALIGITNLLDEEYSRREAAGMYDNKN